MTTHLIGIFIIFAIFSTALNEAAARNRSHVATGQQLKKLCEHGVDLINEGKSIDEMKMYLREDLNQTSECKEKQIRDSDCPEDDELLAEDLLDFEKEGLVNVVTATFVQSVFITSLAQSFNTLVNLDANVIGSLIDANILLSFGLKDFNYSNDNSTEFTQRKNNVPASICSTFDSIKFLDFHQ